MKQPTLKLIDRERVAVKADGTRIAVKDSKFSFLLQPNAEDIKYGIPGDHTECMYCRACRRMYESSLVWVTRMYAYVELKGRRGKPELHRFVLRDPAKANIKDFDAAKDVTPEAVIFAAPTGSFTLAWQAAKSAKGRKKAYILGEIAKSGENKAPAESSSKEQPRKKPQHFSSLRDQATGKFHFSVRK